MKLRLIAIGSLTWSVCVAGAAIAEVSPDVVELAELDPSQGIVFGSFGRRLGYSLERAGDVNGDGFDDVVIGSPTTGGFPPHIPPGHAYVVFGSASTPSEMSLAEIPFGELDGTNGFHFAGSTEFDLTGISVAATDLNGDGIGDVVIGASGSDVTGSNQGEAYIVFGRVDGFPPRMTRDDLDGHRGFAVVGAFPGNGIGVNVTGGADLNADGFEDLAVGGQWSGVPGESRGEVHVLFGSAAPFPARMDPRQLDGVNGFSITGIEPTGRTYVPRFIGDFNGDGIDDLAVGSLGDGPNGTNSGQVFVVYGRTGAWPEDFDLATLDGVNGFTVPGLAPSDRMSVGGRIGDFNGDGLADLAMTAMGFREDDGSSKAYLLFGTDEALPASFSPSSLNGSNGFAIRNGADEGGFYLEGVSGVGDIDGDGLDDLALGSSDTIKADPVEFGRVYLLFGTRDTQPALVNLETLTPPQGFVVIGDYTGGRTGFATAPAGDHNGDGYLDWLVGAPGRSAQNPGQAYLLFGGPVVLPIEIDVWPRGPDVIHVASPRTLHVALFGSASLDVADIEPGSLAFGPAGAGVARGRGPQVRDVDDDGHEDLVAHFRVSESGLAVGDATACVRGRLASGRHVEGCDTVTVCGPGFEVALVPPAWIWVRARRRRVHTVATRRFRGGTSA